MTLAGWIFMLTSVTCVTGLVVWCFYRVFTRPSSMEDMHAPLDIDPQDREV